MIFEHDLVVLVPYLLCVKRNTKEIDMGGTKRMLEAQEDMRSQAYMLLIKEGAIKECAYHSHVYMSMCDDEAVKQAYAIGTNMWKNGEVEGDREDFMGAIKSVMDDSAFDCSACENHRHS